MTSKAYLHSVQVRDKNNQWVPHPHPAADNLFNETTFYPAFTKDISDAKREVIIYSPFVSKYRSDTFNRIINKLKDTNVDLFIFTRPVDEYDREQQFQVRQVLDHYSGLGACVYYLKGSIHEKAAVIDREILWEGSLNILSQRESREMMRRVTGEDVAMQVIRYLGLNRLLAEGYRLKYERLYRSLMEDGHRRRKLSLYHVILGLLALAALWWIWGTLLGMIPLKGVITVLQAVKVLTSN